MSLATMTGIQAKGQQVRHPVFLGDALGSVETDLSQASPGLRGEGIGKAEVERHAHGWL